ncbi:MAG TPA: glycosyltransferase family 39 protein [Xanthobacteraceae bacterium]|nr:glycosyltransferase family 39 protein [Xanthobacteraceae bacterium]
MTLFSATAVPERRYQSVVLATILTLVAVRLVFAGMAPLSFDESLYWLWSKHIVGGYLDHPPVNPFLIRLGTTLFGDTEFGVRVIGVLLVLPATWAIWRSGTILFDDDRIGATAALYFNLTIVVIAGSALATPDNALVVSTAFLLFTLVKLWETGRGAWWLAIGVVFGIGLLSKYTTVFFAVSILVWLLMVPNERKWLFTPWPWVSGLIATAVFSPTLIWNAEHGWASYHYQFGRLVVHEWSLRYLGEFFITQAGMATPPIFVLGCLGLAAMLKGEGGPRPARVLINAMVWPIVLYFVWHTFHGRVEGNWPEPIYVPFVIAAAVAADHVKWNETWAPLASWSARLAVPVGLGIAVCLYLQAVFGVLPLGRIDPTARALGAGWNELAAKLDEARIRIGAPIVLTTDYGIAGWLTFYLPSHPVVAQVDERMRYVDLPQPAPALFAGTSMYVCEMPCGALWKLKEKFSSVELIATFPRTRHGVTIKEYSAYRLAGPTGQVLDPPLAQQQP